MGKKVLSGIMIALLAAMILSIQPAAHAQPPPVKIGWSMPLSGAFAPTAFVHHLYYWMVIDDFNEKGGLDIGGVKRPIVGIPMDDGIETPPYYDYDKCKQNYLYLIEEEGCDLLFAPWSTTFNTAALHDIFEPYEYPVAALTVGSNSLSDYLMNVTETPWMFLTLGQPWEDALELVGSPEPGIQGVFEFINSKVPDAIKIRKVGITYRNDEHGLEHGAAIKNALTALGIEVVDLGAYPLDITDWSTIVGGFKEENVDVCIVCGYAEVSGFVWECITQAFNPKLIVHGPAMETSFLVYSPPPMGFNFTTRQVYGLMYYNGFPACAYLPGTAWYEWYRKHAQYTYNATGGMFPHGYPPFPASAVFYAGVECMLIAADKYDLNRPAIRLALETETFDITLGLGKKVGTLKFRNGRSPIISGHGTITQWQGQEIMQVIWPPDASSSGFIVYPKPPWEESWPANCTDFNRDERVDMKDIVLVIGKFGTKPCMFEWLPWYDINGDNKVDMKDIILTIGDFGKKYTYGGGIIKVP